MKIGKLLKSIFLLVFISGQLAAQPAPCMGESMILLEGISNVDTANLSVYFGQLNYKGRPTIPWSELIDNTQFSTVDLKLLPRSIGENCTYHTFKSPNSDKLYLIGYSLNDAVLLIKSKHETMYLVFPNGNSNKLISPLFHPMQEEILKKNNFMERAYYTPSIYLPRIQFKAGIFFLDDYKLDRLSEKAQSFLAKECLEFYNPNGNMHKSPLEYWKDSIYFFAPFTEGYRFSKKIKGNFTESEAIERIIQNSCNFTLEIYSNYKWEKYFRNKIHSNADIALGTFLHEVLLRQEQAVKELLESYESGKLTEKQLLESYEKLERKSLFLLLEKDFDLMLLFCHYFKTTHTSIAEFRALFEEGSYVVDKKEIEQFLKRNE